MKLNKIFKGFGILVIIVLLLIYLKVSSEDREFETCTIEEYVDLEKIDRKKYDSILVSASTLYDSDVFKDLIQGNNYRDAWSTPVKFPILYLDTLDGGVSIVKEGGGKQTQSLRLKARNGTLYTLRSINKNPQKLIPEFAKTLGLKNIVVDGISAQHPYAAPVVAKLADEVDVLHTHPQAVFLPFQEKLGPYNVEFGNRLFMLEYENKGDYNWTNLKNVHSIIDTEDLQKLKMEVCKSLSIDKDALIRARLFDLVIGDWDRHAKQWGWVVIKKDSAFTAQPLPTDRDNAFFNAEGLIPSIITTNSIEPKVQTFTDDIDYMPGLIYDFDVYFLKPSDSILFQKQADHIIENLTDKSIEDAMRYWNDELYDLYAEDISKKIRSRRDRLKEFADLFRKNLDEKLFLDKPLKGCEDNEISDGLIKCFECGQ